LMSLIGEICRLPHRFASAGNLRAQQCHCNVNVIIIFEGLAYSETLAPRPSDLLCVPIYFILPVVPYLWQSTVSAITKSYHSPLLPYKRLCKLRNLNLAKAVH
jgi:hypothetical protein